MTAGTVIGGLVAMWVKARRPVAFGMAARMLEALPVIAFAARLPLFVIVFLAVIGATGGIILNTNRATAIQQVIPNEVLSRIRSYDYLLASARPVAAPPAGQGNGARAE
jgi:hypothetical protein